MGIDSCTAEALGDLVADSGNTGKLLALFDCGDMVPLSVVDEGDVLNNAYLQEMGGCARGMRWF